MKITNQKPVELSPVYQPVMRGQFDPVEDLRKTMAEPLFNPMVAGTPVTMTSNGNNIDSNAIAQAIVDCCGDVQNATAEAMVKEIFHQTLQHFDRNTPMFIQEAFVVQSAVAENLPYPSPTTIYTPTTDVIPASKGFLAGSSTYDEFFASLAFYARPRTLGFYFANDVAFEDFKTWFAGEIANISAGLPSTTNQLCSDFQQLTLHDLTESLKIRDTENDNNNDYDFARVLMSLLMAYTKTVSPALFGVLPFNVGELFCPLSIVFVNVERHAHASAKQVRDEWDIINRSINTPIKMVSNRKLSKLTSTIRNQQKAASMAANAVSNMNAPLQKAANFKFRKTEVTTTDITKLVKKIVDRMAFVNKSDNVFKSSKMTFARPNRRDPDDFNKQGKMVSTRYKPDIHIYLDTSGSISEQNYQDAVKALIVMAKKMNVNLYFNSFSHVMSQTTHLRTKDKSRDAIYRQFQKTPKVSGGTDYEQIWHFINRNKKRKRELSLIVTDFEYHAPNHYVEHPKNLFYLPCTHMDWDNMQRWADSFCRSMLNNDPGIRAHILF